MPKRIYIVDWPSFFQWNEMNTKHSTNCGAFLLSLVFGDKVGFLQMQFSSVQKYGTNIRPYIWNSRKFRKSLIF